MTTEAGPTKRKNVRTAPYQVGEETLRRSLNGWVWFSPNQRLYVLQRQPKARGWFLFRYGKPIGWSVNLEKAVAFLKEWDHGPDVPKPT